MSHVWSDEKFTKLDTLTANKCQYSTDPTFDATRVWSISLANTA